MLTVFILSVKFLKGFNYASRVRYMGINKNNENINEKFFSSIKYEAKQLVLVSVYSPVVYKLSRRFQAHIFQNVCRKPVYGVNKSSRSQSYTLHTHSRILKTPRYKSELPLGS